MAKKDIDIIIRARDMASRTLKKIGANMKRFSTGIVGNVVKKAFGAITGIISKLINLIKKLIGFFINCLLAIFYV